MTLDEIKLIWIPKNVTVPRNNKYDEYLGAIPNEAFNLHDSIITVLDSVGGIVYTHPDHTGDVTSIADGATTIINDAVTNSKLANMPANTVKVRNEATSGDPVDLSIGTNQILGRESGNIIPITIGSNLNLSSGVLSATGVSDGDKGDITVASGNWTIDADVVDNTKLSNMPANTVKVRNQATSGDPVDLSIPTNQLLGRGLGDITPITLGTNLSISGSTLNAASSLSDGDKGDITVSGSGSVWTIDDDVITNSKLANAPAYTLKGNNTGLSTDPLDLTVVQVQSLLSIDDLITLSGVSEGSLHLGTFTGSTIPDNSTIKAALQSLEDVITSGGVSSNGITGNGSVGTPYKLGAPLTQSTTIDGSEYAFTLQNTGSVYLEAQTAAGTNVSELLLSPSNIFGAYLRTKDALVAGKEVSIAFDLDTNVGYYYKSGVSGQEVGFGLKVDPVFSSTGPILKTPNYATASTGQVPVLQSNGTLEYGTVAASLVEYTVTISGTANSTARVLATSTGATISYASNKFTVSQPPTGRVVAIDLRVGAADVQATADAGGATNWVLAEFTSTSGNTDATNFTDIRIPNVQKTSLPSTSPLATNNAATLDIDNNPLVSVTSVGSGNITLRVSGLLPGSKGYHLKFSNI